jgi:type 1 fimbriae regulatory protein FimE
MVDLDVRTPMSSGNIHPILDGCIGRNTLQGGGFFDDTRALQHYLGHKNIQHTVCYAELAHDRFKGFWQD